MNVDDTIAAKAVILAAMELGGLRFENRFVEALPGDPVALNAPREVRGACYTRVDPTPVAAPRLLAWSGPLGRLLGLDGPDEEAVQVLGGNRVLPGMAPYASRYGGHQFGHWAGQLGDGRAVTLAEALAPSGDRLELQLKGAGLTPYARFADGRAVLRSSLREFLCSEAMHHLGVPTTRALSLVGTGESVERDMFYDGRPRLEPGAVVCRVAPSFLRFGHFEIHAACRETELLRRLADHAIAAHFPGLQGYEAWFAEICRRTGVLVAEWMRVGFVHGVMNTDNMSLLGLTIDYGPYGWLEGYDPDWTPNTTDAARRRYSYGNQPDVALWNLERLAEALSPLIPDRAALEQGLRGYVDAFQQGWGERLSRKLGLPGLGREGDQALVADLFETMQATETDTTILFRRLSRLPAAAEGDLLGPLAPAFYDAAAFASPDLRGRWNAWLRRYRDRVRAEGLPDDARRAIMDAANPKFVPRNYLAQQAIDALEAGDPGVLERLMKALERPYDEQPEHEELAARRPEWARSKPGCSALSCSS
jgi:uncharacterized protein YdiU (UPF0061 family)